MILSNLAKFVLPLVKKIVGCTYLVSKIVVCGFLAYNTFVFVRLCLQWFGLYFFFLFVGVFLVQFLEYFYLFFLTNTLSYSLCESRFLFLILISQFLREPFVLSPLFWLILFLCFCMPADVSVGLNTDY